ncbi:MAG: hypothetical protein ACJ72E_07990 [Marmoricola sp.]
MLHLRPQLQPHYRPDHLPQRIVRRAVLGLLLITLALGMLAPGTRTPASAIGYSPLLDALSPYEGQTVCTTSPRPGTVALAHWLLRTYRVTRSMGMMRACGSGGQSEHKDGRAFDWGADVARPATRRAAYDFIGKALAPDASGNEHALARRLGIMYIIYNDTIWSSSHDFVPRPYLNSGCKSLRKCSRTLRHKNHVHISLGYAGAAAQTSWYRARNIASNPVLLPGTKRLDPDETAVTGFTVPADGRLVTSPFVLEAGVTYRLVATGVVRHGAGLGDATCTHPDDGTTWSPTPRGPALGLRRALSRLGGGWGWGQPSTGSSHPASPNALPLPTTQGLVVQGGLRWEGDCDPVTHTYQAWFTPLTDQKLQLRYLDVPAGDDTGTFSVYVARDDIAMSSLARR